MQFCQRLCRMKICNPAGIVLLQEIYNAIVKAQETQMKLCDNQILIVAHIVRISECECTGCGDSIDVMSPSRSVRAVSS